MGILKQDLVPSGSLKNSADGSSPFDVGRHIGASRERPNVIGSELGSEPTRGVVTEANRVETIW